MTETKKRAENILNMSYACGQFEFSVRFLCVCCAVLSLCLAKSEEEVFVAALASEPLDCGVT